MKIMLRSFIAAAAVLGAFFTTARGDEGMWTFDKFPFDKVEKAYGFRPTRGWLDHVRLSTLRLLSGDGVCSAAFVSPQGLVQTNHHCARDCIAQLSNASRDYIATGLSKCSSLG